MKRATMPSSDEAWKMTAHDVGRSIGGETGKESLWRITFLRVQYTPGSPQWNIAMQAAREAHEDQVRKEQLHEKLSSAWQN